MRSAAFLTLLCSCAGPPSGEVLSEAELSPSGWLVVGRLSEPDLLAPYVSYTGTPRLLAVELDAVAGLPLELTVRPQTGDPVSLLRAPSGKVVASFRDHLAFRPRVSGRYVIVFRERLARKTVFAVGVSGAGKAHRMKMAWQQLASDQAALDRHLVAATALPAPAHDRFLQEQTKFGGARAYGLDGVFAVASGQEERFWVDLYDARGALVAHGYDGDSGPMIATWLPSPYDPSR